MKIVLNIHICHTYTLNIVYSCLCLIDNENKKHVFNHQFSKYILLVHTILLDIISQWFQECHFKLILWSWCLHQWQVIIVVKSHASIQLTGLICRIIKLFRTLTPYPLSAEIMMMLVVMMIKLLNNLLVFI